MDGITVMMTAEFLKPYTSQLDWEDLNDFERIVIADINLDLDQIPPNYRGTKFHQNVTIPTQKFVNYWGGEELYRHLIKAMLTGKMRELVRYFDSKTGRKNYWKLMFKSASY